MLIATALLAVLLAADTGEPAPPAAEDEARIEALMAAERAQAAAIAEHAEEAKAEAEELAREHQTEQFPPAPGTAIAFEDIGKMKGRGVRVHTVAGRVHAGTVEQVSNGELLLRERMKGGYAEYTLTRKQVARIEAE